MFTVPMLSLKRIPNVPLGIAVVVSTIVMGTASHPYPASATHAGFQGKQLRTLLPDQKLHFEPVATADGEFQAVGERYRISLAPDALQVGFPAWQGYPAASLGIRFEDAIEGRLLPRQRLSSVSHHLLGNDPAAWRKSVPHYGQLLRPGLYPGIDAVFYGDPRRLEFDLRVWPGADPSRIRLRLSGAGRVWLDEEGDLLIEAGPHRLRQVRPFSYQQGPEGRQEIASRYRLLDSSTVTFEVGPYDPALPLVIDPVLSFFTYLGGAGDDAAHALLDAGDGMVYVCGETASVNFPSEDALQGQTGGSRDAFLSLVDTRSQSLVFSTYLGGSNDDICRRLARDGAGDVYLLGQTESLNFPTVNATQPFRRGNVDVFISKLSPQGDELLRSTYLGGSSPDLPGDIFAAEDGGVTVVGHTTSFNFPLFLPFQEQQNGAEDLFITRFAPAGAMIFSTYLGGSGADRVFDAHFETPGLESFVVNIVGETRSEDFPLQDPFDATFAGQSEGFLLRFDLQVPAILSSSYLGGSEIEIARRIHVDPFGIALLAGETTSDDFDVVDGIQGQRGGGRDLFVVRLNTSTNTPIFSTYLGGSGDEFLNASQLASAGRVLLAGHTNSTDLPTEDAVQPVAGGGFDGFVIDFDTNGRKLVSSTYLGGSGRDEVRAVQIDSRGRFLLAGLTDSDGLAAGSSPLRPERAAGRDAFLAALVDTAVLNFAQFGDGEEAGISFASRIELVNTDTGDAASVEVILRGDDGSPMQVDLNGEQVEGRLERQIPAGANLSLATDGQGALQTGSVQVVSDLSLSAFVFFDAGDIGATGVGASPRLRGFVTPVQAGGGNNTGLALMGLGAAQELGLQLRNAAGETVAEAVLQLGGFEHRALFVTEVEWDQEVDFSDFQGNLRVTGSQEFSATAIRLQPGQFIVLPVTPLP
ncbi:MAG TPA: SBBP repeat-containing protein [Acidobacteriota bacterium]|nr:SBBP repeat-containing protein [Acidobacteriota bacterium]